MSNTTIQNQNVSVTLKSLGGELTSIKDASGTEYLWQGNPDFWSGQAPVLFPIVGCLRNEIFAGADWWGCHVLSTLPLPQFVFVA